MKSEESKHALALGIIMSCFLVTVLSLVFSIKTYSEIKDITSDCVYVNDARYCRVEE